MKMRCIKTVKWDNCMGQFVIAFRVGDVVEVEPVPEYDDGGYGSATSPYHRGISDFVPLDHFEALTAEEVHPLERAQFVATLKEVASELVRYAWKVEKEGWEAEWTGSALGARTQGQIYDELGFSNLTIHP